MLGGGGFSGHFYWNGEKNRYEEFRLFVTNMP